MKQTVRTIVLSAAIFAIACCVQSCSGRSSSQQEDSSSPEKLTEEVDEKDITKAIARNDYATAHSILMEIYQDYSQKASDNDGTGGSNVDKAHGEFWGAANQLYVSEIQYLMPMNDMEANDKLLYSLRSLVPVGKRPHYNKSYRYFESKGSLKDYANFVDSYNNLCGLILEVAITHGNKDMAKKILGLYKDEYVWENIDGNNAKFTKDTSTKEEAKERFSEAESNGEI